MGDRKDMTTYNSLVFGVCLVVAAALGTPARAQAGTNCSETRAAAVQCFVANAVATKLAAPRYGMTLEQFEDYGVAVSSILQTHHTYLSLVGISSAIADAMPPTNADGSSNQAAQDAAVETLVSAAVANHLADLSTGVTEQDLEWFSLDVVSAMNESNGYLSLLTPGVSLRIMDSYIVTATENGIVNWSQACDSISNAVNSLLRSGMIRIPSEMSKENLIAFLEAAARAIGTYKATTRRRSL
jgi:hypothetical protein